jgi:cysteine desulfuration protein SufE
MTIEELQNEIIEEFTVYDDWMDRYQYLIDLSKELLPIDEKYKVSQNLIKGCQSNVWLNAELVDGKVIFAADSDALITKGIVSMLIKVLSGHTPKEILNAELFFIDAIGLKENLSPTRSNGLVSMIKQMKGYEMAFQYKQEQ